MAQNTVRAWLLVLEASFVVFRIPHWHQNLRKRAGRARSCTSWTRGSFAISWAFVLLSSYACTRSAARCFESCVASEIRKARFNAGLPADLFHFREDRGTELDLIVEAGAQVHGVEVKSAATLVSEFFRNPTAFATRLSMDLPHLDPVPRIVYGGDRRETRGGIEVIPWMDVQNVAW